MQQPPNTRPYNEYYINTQRALAQQRAAKQRTQATYYPTTAVVNPVTYPYPNDNAIIPSYQPYYPSVYPSQYTYYPYSVCILSISLHSQPSVLYPTQPYCQCCNGAQLTTSASASYYVKTSTTCTSASPFTITDSPYAVYGYRPALAFGAPSLFNGAGRRKR